MASIIPAVFGWNLSDVMILYWSETAVTGFFNLCKIIVVGRWSALLFGPFFAGHFGGFMAIHFLFIYTIFVTGLHNAIHTEGDLDQVKQLFVALWPALFALFISHCYSFFHNFLGRREYVGRTVSYQMGEPYSRIVFMHLVLIFGGRLVMVLGLPVPVLLLVIGPEIFLDLKSHLKQRANTGNHL